MSRLNRIENASKSLVKRAGLKLENPSACEWFLKNVSPSCDCRELFEQILKARKAEKLLSNKENNENNEIIIKRVALTMKLPC